MNTNDGVSLIQTMSNAEVAYAFQAVILVPIKITKHQLK